MAKPTKKQQKIKTEIEMLALTIVDNERVNWEEAVCWVTEKVGFRMRELIRIVRKNYWGVFDEPTDPTTGRDKFWVPLARTLTEDVVKNIDLDQKDLQFRATTPDGFTITDITRAYVQDYLTKMFFGEILDETERQMCIDGTVVWKTWKENGEMMRRDVDLLHIYIDPSEKSIQSAFRFTERGLNTPDEIAGMTGWMNTDGIYGSQSLSKNDIRVGSGSTIGVPTTGRFVDVWEMWGKIPKKLITADFKTDDADDYVDGHIIVSGLEAGDKRVHLIEINKNKDKFGKSIKPYEEARVAKIAGRWYGLGIVERCLALQEWLNTTVNLRINKSYVSQLGLFKIRKGSNITPQMLAKLPSNGAITVNQMDDIQPMEVPPVDETSYKDEEVITAWAQKVTQAYPVSSGEQLPASQTATATATAAASAKDGYSMMKDALGFFLERWMDRHALPIIAGTIKTGDLVRLSGDDEKYRQIIERVVSNMAQEKLDELYEKGIVPSQQQVDNEIQNQMELLSKRPDMFVKLTQKIISEQLGTRFYVTNEDLDTTVTVQNLISMLNLAPEYKDATVKQIYDLMGLPQPKANPQPQIPPQTAQGVPQGQQSTPQPQQAPASLQGITTGAMTPQLG